MNPNLRNFFMKKLTREMLVPTVCARTAKLIFGTVLLGLPFFPKLAKDLTITVAVTACGLPLRHPSPREKIRRHNAVTAVLPNLETTVSLTRPF
jgi:hypothetical protein